MLLVVLGLVQAYNIDYILTYDGNTSTNMRFANAFSTSNIIDTHYNISSCIYNCSNNSLCNGYFVYNNSCNELYNTNDYVYTDLNCSSYSKIIHYEGNYNHSIEGIAVSTRDFRNSTVYLDLNYNGILDLGEPYMSTRLFYYFDNLLPGNYLLRLEYNDGCYGLLPDIFGITDPLINDYSDSITHTYIDVINNYRGYNHEILGGNISDSEIVLDNLDYLIDFNNETYISFYDKDSIIIGFSNSTIINDFGNDLIFVLNSTGSNIQARVSVSTLNYRDLRFLGILNESNYKFDLGSINYTYPVNHLHLNFYSDNNENKSLNIASIMGEHIIDYIPYNSFYIQVPTTEQFAFISDCDYIYSCEDFCDYNTHTWDEFISCNIGCILAERDLICDCSLLDYQNQDNLYSNPLYPNVVLGNFSINQCHRGCEYHISKFVFPNFTYTKNGIGEPNSITETSLGCNNRSCLDNMIDKCYDIDCVSFSLSLGDNTLFYNSSDYYYSENYNIFVYNPTYHDRYNDFGYNTYSPTFTPTNIPTPFPTFTPINIPTTTLNWLFLYMILGVVLLLPIIYIVTYLRKIVKEHIITLRQNVSNNYVNTETNL